MTRVVPGSVSYVENLLRRRRRRSLEVDPVRCGDLLAEPDVEWIHGLRRFSHHCVGTRPLGDDYHRRAAVRSCLQPRAMRRDPVTRIELPELFLAWTVQFLHPLLPTFELARHDRCSESTHVPSSMRSHRRA